MCESVRRQRLDLAVWRVPRREEPEGERLLCWRWDRGTP